MAYEVIARKWRPQTFDEVVGQEAITRTLRNAVANERLHHAYLFTGARGVGKTTTARILAKSLNCAKGVTPEPCGECPSCVEIASGGSLDVIEIDAASHTGVDNIRDVVINSVNIAPARDRYKVFIVDEVHQLSAAAFNALLKTLEEPPSRVVFVLATTELHKVPDTITSRCQLFEFRTISLGKIQTKLGEIAADMGVAIAPAALAAVARAGEGSMRDAQSALDQVIAFGGETIEIADVTTALGVVGDETLYDAVDAISRGDAPALLRIAADVVATGQDVRSFVRSMMRAVRNLLVARAVGYDAELVDAAEADAERISELASRFAESELVRAFALLAQLEQDIRHSADPRFQLEIGLVRLAELPRLRPLDEILERLSKLEARLSGNSGAAAADFGATRSEPRSAPERAPAPRASAPPAPPSRPAAPPSPPAPRASEPRASAPRSFEPPPEPPPFDEPPFFDDEPSSPSPPASRQAAGEPAAPSAPDPLPRGAMLDGDDAVAAIRAAVEAANKMLWLTALDAASEVKVEDGKLVVAFSPEASGNRRTLERSRVSLERVAREATGRTIKLVTSDADAGAAPKKATPKAAPKATPEAAPEAEAAPAPRPRPEPAPEAVAPADPAVQSMLDMFKGEIISVEPPPETGE